MWLLGLLVGFINAISYRIEGAGLAVVLLSLIVIFYLHTKLLSLRQKCVLWFLFGLSYYVTSLFWVNGYLAQEYGDASWIKWGLWPLLILILSASFLVVPLCLMRLKPLSALIALPFVLTSLDILREQTSFSFSWLHPGFLLLDVGFSGWLSTIGAFGGSLLIYLCASAFVWLLLQGRTFYKPLLLTMLFLLSITLLDIVMKQGMTTKMVSGNNQEPTSASLRILHGNFSGTHKLSKNDVIERIQHYVSLSLQAPKAEFVVWPESSMSLPYQEVKPFIAESLKRLDEKQVVAIWGGQARNGQHLQNVIYRSDQTSPIYYKQRLVPFGEYRPAWFVDWIERVTLSRGGDIQVIPNIRQEHEFGLFRAVIGVCYEALYSDVFASKLQTGNVAFLLSDVEWTQTPWVKRFLLTLAKVRAAEVGKPIVYSSNQGYTSLIGADGSVLHQIENQRTQVLDVSVPLNAAQTLYTRYGHQWLLWFAVIVILGIHFIHHQQRINSIISNNKRCSLTKNNKETS